MPPDSAATISWVSCRGDYRHEIEECVAAWAEHAFDRAAEHVEREHVEREVQQAAVQERVRDDLPRHERNALPKARGRERPQRERDDKAGYDRLQQEQRDVGDDQRGGDGWHGRELGARTAQGNPDSASSGTDGRDRGLYVFRPPSSSRRRPGASTSESLAAQSPRALLRPALSWFASSSRWRGHWGGVDGLRHARAEGARAHLPRRQVRRGLVLRAARGVQDLYLPVTAPPTPRASTPGGGRTTTRRRR